MKQQKKSLTIMSIVGTRPEIIRLSRVLPKLDEYFHHIMVYTRQSYDYELSDIFFEELELRRPDYFLDVKSDSLGGQIARIIEQSEAVLKKEMPDALLVLGDTNSCLSAVIAKRMHIPIFHMEAGNRSFDWDVPEEVNRRIVDHISDFNLCYTEHARRYLIREGLHPKTIFVTGSPYAEILAYYNSAISGNTVLTDLNLIPGGYFLVSVHREENIEKPDRIRELFASLGSLADAYKKPVLLSVHPRTQKKLASLGSLHPLIHCHKPFGFLEFARLEKNAFCVISDSGTIQEESAIAGFPAVQVRVSTERPEAFDAGSIIVTGFHKDALNDAIKMATGEFQEHRVIPADYRDVNVSEKVVKIILGHTAIRKYHKL
ncbi:UDP-N-acetylglucosamine 2-epimerase (non-hydrolyzing) [Candidatus Gottesmanbacteria bacterium]|nr:UDP-N-acetylglucosamine 2-epimerase (non-hydrolyzing) [Candidatus Gottesmanbacteria bacterium]